jgi:acylphosphatase
MAPSSESSLTLLARRCHVSGRVQGVHYRASAAQRARGLGLAGYARNLPDGRVEVLVVGQEPAVIEFIEWLWVGPSAAKVRAVEVVALEVAALEDPVGGLPAQFTTA